MDGEIKTQLREEIIREVAVLDDLIQSRSYITPSHVGYQLLAAATEFLDQIEYGGLEYVTYAYLLESIMYHQFQIDTIRM